MRATRPSTALAEEVALSGLANKSPALCRTRQLLTAGTNSRHLPLSCTRSAQFVYPCRVSFRSFLKLLPQSRLCVQEAVLQISAPRPACTCPVSRTYRPQLPFDSSSVARSNSKWRDVHITKLLITQFSTSPLSPPPSQAEIRFPAPHSRTPSVYALPVT